MFKPKDIVRRIKTDCNGAKVGKIYTVKFVYEKKFTSGYSLELIDINGSFDSSFFELIESVPIELTTGMRIVYSSGEVGIVLKDINLIAFQGTGFNLISMCNQVTNEDYLIEKVYHGYKQNSNILNFDELGVLLWERKSTTQIEIEKIEKEIYDLNIKLQKLKAS